MSDPIEQWIECERQYQAVMDRIRQQRLREKLFNKMVEDAIRMAQLSQRNIVLETLLAPTKDTP